MRLIILLTANIVAVATYAFWEGTDVIWQDLQNTSAEYALMARELYYKKEVHVNGVKRIRAMDVRDLLPIERSNIWWLANENTLEASLLRNPLIESADISRCTEKKWGCFTVSVKERQPKYIALLGKEPWILGDDGGFIAPFKEAETPLLQSSRRELKNAVLIKGLLERELSPDILRAKINLLAEAISIIETQTKLKITELDLNDQAEAEVVFASYNFKTKFNFEGADIERIRDQALRLRKIMSEVKGRTDPIYEIDLAFEKVAVVKNKTS